MCLDDMRIDCAEKQKKGLHFILASVLIWSAILTVHLSSLPILTKNFLTFCLTAPLMPLAYVISKIMKVDFMNKENPLTKLGVVLSLNQILYLLIAMWVYPTVPDKMVMVLAIIFGAHLLPFGWLYKSKAYSIMSITISVSAIVSGIMFNPIVVAIVLILIEIIFSVWIAFENKKLVRKALT